MNKNIAVIGCGYWGKNLVRNFSEIGALAAICDPDNIVAQTFSEKYNVESLSFAEIIKHPKIKGIVLAVPAPLHASMAIEAMNAGKHVYVEKPLAMNTNEAEDMIFSSNHNNVNLMVGHLLQYHPVFISALEIIKNGKIGNLSYIYSNRLSFGKFRKEEDVIWSFAPHDISMILSIVEMEPVSVKTDKSYILQHKIADIATIHMEFASGLKAHISVSWLHPFKEQKIVIIGTFGTLVFDDTKPWHEKLALYKHIISSSNEEPNIDKGKVNYIDIPRSEPLKNECLHFIDVVNGNKSPLTDAEEGLKVLRILMQTAQY